MDISRLRNFVIIAHIDHGKSTLADRFLEMTGTVEKRLMRAQYLDQLESERERGITIKMAPVRMLWHPEILNPKYEIRNKSQIPNYKIQNSLELRASNLEFADSEFIMNLIDTPGHSDFSYEVSRALAAVEGAILLVDASQGIQAQTLANLEHAKKAGLTIIGAVSKIDLPSIDIEAAVGDLTNLLGVHPKDILRVSGKTGQGVEELLRTVVERIQPPTEHRHIVNRQTKTADDTLDANQTETSDLSRALVFDSLYDDHKGIIAFVRVVEGRFERDQRVQFLATGAAVKVKEVGWFHPQLKPCPALTGGDIGYIATGIKDPGRLKIGDTVVKCPLSNVNCQTMALPGFREPQPVVFVSFYPEDGSQYDQLKQALEKLCLTDAALRFEPDTSEVLGRGFKGGFLGRLHFEIAAERLEKEFQTATVHSFPSVAYHVLTRAGEIEVKSPKDFPADCLEAREPIARVEILTPPRYLGGLLALKEFFRFSQTKTETVGDKALVTALLPLADLISDLDDKLKSLSEGYASLSYEVIGYQRGDLEKLEVLVAGQIVPGLTRILPRERIEREARQTVERLKELLPRQQFVQAVQAASRGRIIARETIPALKKDVTGYLYGGDRTRKMKLWKKQKRGKERLGQQASRSQIKIPASIFKELLKK